MKQEEKKSQVIPKPEFLKNELGKSANVYTCKSEEEFFQAFRELPPLGDIWERQFVPDDNPRSAEVGVGVLYWRKDDSWTVLGISYRLPLFLARGIPEVFEFNKALNVLYEDYFKKMQEKLENICAERT